MSELKVPIFAAPVFKAALKMADESLVSLRKAVDQLSSERPIQIVIPEREYE